MMKRDQARNLQDQFSNLFLPQNHQQSLNENSQTYLLDSQQHSQQLNSITFKQIEQTQSEGEQQDFLDKVDDILQHHENDQQLTRRQIMLGFKVNQLKLMCKNLKLSNGRLTERLEELQSHQSAISQNTVDINRSQDLTIMQQEFTEIEQQLSRYKQQLARYQQQMTFQANKKNQEIIKLRQDFSSLKSVKESLEKELRQQSRVIGLLEQRNQELLLALQQLENNQQQESLHESRGLSNNDNFNDKISYQMQTMIDKLLKELKYQKRSSAKSVAEIKRLNNEVINLQNKVKDKNNKIYQLQLALIKANKPNINEREKSPYKSDYQSKDETLASYFPPRNLITNIENNKIKKQNNVSYFNKNRVSAEREGVMNGKNNSNFGAMLPLSKVFNTFTLMDLLNRQFKIRTAQKYIIASKVVELYANKFQRNNFDNLIPQEIQIFNFSSQNPGQLKVRVNTLTRHESYETNEESMLYNMAFILDTLLNQVQVVDAYLGTALQLNIPDYIELVMGKHTKEDKHKLLLELANSIEREYLTN